MLLVTLEMGFLMVHQLAGEGGNEESLRSTDRSMRLCGKFLKKRGNQVSFGHDPGQMFFPFQRHARGTFLLRGPM